MASLLSALNAYLPQQEGLLPKWLVFVAVIAMGNSIQSYITTSYTARLYAGPAPSPSNPKATPSSSLSPATPLQSRTFGTWTMIQSLVRLYAAYHINESAWYQLAFLTYVVAWAHFMSEWWVFRTAHWGEGLVFPVVIASVSLVWMGVQWGAYVV